MAVLGGPGSLKSPTALLEGLSGYVPGNSGFVYNFSGGKNYDYVASGGVATPINVTGSGVLQLLVFGSPSTSTSANMTVTIDGVQVLDDTRGDINNYLIVAVGNVYNSGNHSAGGQGYVPFNSSLVVTVVCNVNADLAYNYYLT